MKIDLCNPWVFCTLAALAYPTGCLLGHTIDRAIKTIWPPSPMPAATRHIHIRRA